MKSAGGCLSVVRPGVQTIVQDLGRCGLRALGVAPGGALDVHAARVANILVGNDESAALLEAAWGGLRLRFNDERLMAWCGGAVSVRVVPGTSTTSGATAAAAAPVVVVPAGRPCLLRAGDALEVKSTESGWGCRAWLATSGGIDVAPVLGSRSTDLRAGFGGMHGRALRAGDCVPLGVPSHCARKLALALAAQNTRIASWGAPATAASPAMRRPVLRILRGRDWARFASSALATFLRSEFTVTPECDRTGARLDGPLLTPGGEAGGSSDEISEPVAPGTIQVPPGGQPILLLADCGTIGGYPKLAHVITIDLPVAAQLRPGDAVRFREVTPGEAHRLLAAREQDLEIFRKGVTLRMAMA